MQKKYTLEDFREIMKALRAEDGCPWDKVQTHQSLRPCMMEEAAELISSIRIYDQTGNAENMREELGDILLQVVMHSQIASEEGLFTWEDVVQEVSEKMIRRHPNVFGNVIEKDTMEHFQNWDEIKKQEKAGKEWIETPLREIPYELPALTRAPKILKKVDKLYQKADTYEESMHKLQSSVERLSLIGQVRKEMPEEKEKIQAEITELLWSISNISRIFRIPQEQLLNDKIEETIELHEKGKHL
ncbi:MAG: MazG family protein [Lachnospiraceae bacterium]|nr:MazG family protein [Lachnospiraceae bacterium]